MRYIIRLTHNELKGCYFCVSLNHILSHYDGSRGFYRRSLLRHSLFAQSLLENPDLLHSRISALRKNTAFMSLGPYVSYDCGRFVVGPGLIHPFWLIVAQRCPRQ